MRFTVVHASGGGGPVGDETCTRWNLAYRLVRENGKLRILVPNAASAKAWVRCDQA
jgi:predicted SAM-dependent methyltransferase